MLSPMARKAKDTCRNGHPMKDPNLIWHKRGEKQIRECRACANLRYRSNRKAKKRNKALLSSLEAGSA